MDYGEFRSSELTPIPGTPKSRVDISNYRTEWEDADTLLLHAPWWQFWRDPIAIRLSGIDAPEISHPDDPLAWMRFHQEQPHGRQSLEYLNQITAGQQLELEVASDPAAKTYGRYLGLVSIAGHRDPLNLELVRAGQVAALPFGESGSDIYPREAFIASEKYAQSEGRGIWSLPWFQRYKNVSSALGGRITFNSLTDLGRLSQNYNLAAMESFLSRGDTLPNERFTARYIGRKLIPSYGRFFSGRDDSYNTIEGLRHGGMAEESRREKTDFGSGYDAIRAMARMAGMSFEQFTGREVFQAALREGKVLKKLGEGVFGEAFLMKGRIGNKSFRYVKKVTKELSLLEKVKSALRVRHPSKGPAYKLFYRGRDLRNEAALLSELGETPAVPSVYSSSEKEMFMEWMPGSPRGEAANRIVSQRQLNDLQTTWNKAQELGIVNPDIHGGNILLSGQRASWIDWGYAFKTGDERVPMGLGLYLNRLAYNRYTDLLRGLSLPGPVSGVASVVENVVRARRMERINSNRAVNSFDGMQHGGEGERSRRSHSDFGSWWQGMLKGVSGKVSESLAISRKTMWRSGTEHLPEALQKILPDVQGMTGKAADVLGNLHLAIERSSVSEIEKRQLKSVANEFLRAPRDEDVVIALNPFAIKASAAEEGLSYKGKLKGVLRHERFHARVEKIGLREELKTLSESEFIPEHYRKYAGSHAAEEFLAHALETPQGQRSVRSGLGYRFASGEELAYEQMSHLTSPETARKLSEAMALPKRRSLAKTVPALQQTQKVLSEVARSGGKGHTRYTSSMGAGKAR